MSFAVNVDPTNPGQFFACCGLLELADRLWPGAEGWFADGQFHVTCDGTLADLMAKFGKAAIESSLSAAQLKRLGTLLSVAESKRDAAALVEKAIEFRRNSPRQSSVVRYPGQTSETRRARP